MDLADYISALTFDLAQPDTARVESLRFPLPRAGRPDAELLELPNAPVDVYNARLPEDGIRMARSLRPICGIPRMSTFAVAAIINHAVTRMPAGQTYLNVGVYAGFSFLAGMIDNPRQVCVGVDNFAIAAGRPGLLRRFEEARGPAHRFYEMDYLDYFADVQREQLGVYLYDGDHAYEHQLQGLQQAEPFFADGCVVVVDDTNWEAPRQATIDFVSASAREYEVLLDVATRDHNHPTFWNGLMVLRATGRRRTAQTAEVAGRFERRSYGPTRQALNVAPGATMPTEDAAAGGGPLVSIVLINDDSSGTELATAIEACRAQSWPRTELVVLDRSHSDAARAAAERHSGDVQFVRAPDEGSGSALAEALACTTGDLVAFTDSGVSLRPTAVELALGLVGSHFFTSFGDMRYAERERAVLDR